MATRRTWATLAAVLVSVAVLASGCGGSKRGNASTATSTQGKPVAGGTLDYGLMGETSGWDPSKAQWVGSGYQVANAIFDPLMVYDAKNNVVPYLAKSLTSNKDYTVWTLKLRPGVKFHDGTTFDASAFKTNIEAHQHSIFTAPTVRPISAVKVIDPLTAEIHMSTPWATFPHILTAQPGYMAAPSMLADPKGNSNPVGTGPFTFVSWSVGNELVVKKNPHYWRKGLPYLDKIVYHVITDDNARVNSLAGNQVQAIETFDAKSIIDLRKQADQGSLQLESSTGENTETLVSFNMSKAPFDDILARKAVVYAIDTDTISKTVYHGEFPPARGIFETSSPWYTETSYPHFDLAKAKEFAKQYEAKYGHKLTFTANIIPQPNIQLIAQLLKEQLKNAGIDAKLNTLDQTQLILKLVGGQYEASGFILFGSPHMDRERVFLDPANASGAITLNFARNTDPAIGRALDAMRTTSNLQLQIDAFKKVQDRLAVDLPYAFVVHNHSAHAAKNNVHDLEDWKTPDGVQGSKDNGTAPPVFQVWVS